MRKTTVLAVLSTAAKFTGVRYVFDVTIETCMAMLKPGYYGHFQAFYYWYSQKQNHLPTCPSCHNMVAPWPMNQHTACNEMLIEQNYARRGNWVTAVDTCGDCHYPISARQAKRNSHICDELKPVTRTRLAYLRLRRQLSA